MESRADSIHKLSVCLKELRESRCWLRLAMKAELLPTPRLGTTHREAGEVSGIIGRSIVTAKARRTEK